MAAWVADPTQRWLGDCLSAGSTIGACDDLARALGSRVADFRAAIARAGPSQKRLATVVDGIAWAFRADDLEHEWPRYAALFNRSAVPPISDTLADASLLSPSARSALRGYLREDYGSSTSFRNLKGAPSTAWEAICGRRRTLRGTATLF